MKQGLALFHHLRLNTPSLANTCTPHVVELTRAQVAVFSRSSQAARHARRLVANLLQLSFCHLLSCYRYYVLKEAPLRAKYSIALIGATYFIIKPAIFPFSQPYSGRDLGWTMGTRPPYHQSNAFLKLRLLAYYNSLTSYPRPLHRLTILLTHRTYPIL